MNNQSNCVLDSLNPKTADEHRRLRAEVLLLMRANQAEGSGEAFLAMVFMPLPNLRKMAVELRIA